METLKRFGGAAGFLIALGGAGLVYFVPDRTVYGWSVFAAGMLLLAAAAAINRDDLLNAMKGRPFRHGANAVLYSLLVLAIVGAIGFLAARHNHRIDMTPQGEHSLSAQTVRILQKLDQDLTLLGFFTSTYGGRQKALDLLDEYKYRSSRITLRIVDPVRSPGEVRAYGVETDGTIVVSAKGGEARVTPGGTGLTEQDLTNALIKATSQARKVLCFTTGHAEKGIKDPAPEGLQRIAEALGKESYEVKEIQLISGSVPAECSSVVVAGPAHAFLPPESEAIQGYLAGGGRALVLAEPRTPTGLEGVLARYGLKVRDDFVVDVNPMARLFGGSPAAPAVTEYGTHEITKDFEGVITIFPTAASIETISPSEPGVTTETLVHTSGQSWGELGDLADQVSFDEAVEKAGPLDLAALASKKPAAPPAAADPNSAAGSEPEEAEAAGNAQGARIVLFGDSDYCTNGAVTMGANRDLFMNAVAWLNERADLISIRPKGSTPQPVVLTGLQARFLKWYSLAVGPLAALVVGIGVHLRRRRL